MTRTELRKTWADLENALKLADMASGKHDVNAPLYLHRVVSDLGQFALWALHRL